MSAKHFFFFTEHVIARILIEEIIDRISIIIIGYQKREKHLPKFVQLHDSNQQCVYGSGSRISKPRVPKERLV